MLLSDLCNHIMHSTEFFVIIYATTQVRKMLEIEREKMKKEKEEFRKKKVVTDDKKRQVILGNLLHAYFYQFVIFID